MSDGRDIGTKKRAKKIDLTVGFDRARTCDLHINSVMLYLLSYETKGCDRYCFAIKTVDVIQLCTGIPKLRNSEKVG